MLPVILVHLVGHVGILNVFRYITFRAGGAVMTALVIAFVFGSKADEQKGVDYLTNKMYSLSANKSPLKARVRRRSAVRPSTGA